MISPALRSSREKKKKSGRDESTSSRSRRSFPRRVVFVQVTNEQPASTRRRVPVLPRLSRDELLMRKTRGRLARSISFRVRRRAAPRDTRTSRATPGGGDNLGKNLAVHFGRRPGETDGGAPSSRATRRASNVRSYAKAQAVFGYQNDPQPGVVRELYPWTAMCVRNVDVHVSCSSQVDAQLAAFFIDPRAK